MPAYERFSRFYDEAMDDPAPRAERVQGFIDRHHPHASSLLELGCGTGSILARLSPGLRLTGLDRSPQMLALAAGKIPDVRLVEGDMATFSLEERFDVIICVFDSLNHLHRFEQWLSLFDAVHRHLTDGGLFCFDVNTVGELRRLGDEPAWVYDVGDNVMIMDVSTTEDGMSWWHVQVFEHVGESQYLLHEEVIGELGVRLEQILAALEPAFELLEGVDDLGFPPTDDSVKAHFALRRR